VYSFGVAFPDRAPEWLGYVDHTADAGIVVHASGLKELFARAAWGMFSLLTDLRAIRLAEMTRVHIEASDRLALMVNWLSELNYRHVTERRLFGKFEVIELGATCLEAQIRGEKIDLQRHQIFTEIKAVTFHDLRVERDGQIWKAQIIFDL
jgi:SHS2 domain-containing protein